MTHTHWRKPKPKSNKVDAQHIESLMNAKAAADMTATELGHAISTLRTATKLLEEFESEALRRLKTGKTVTGFKLVHKRANRVWDEVAEFMLTEQFGDDAYVITKKLISPAECERRGCYDIPEDHASVPVAELTIAPLSDKRDRAAPPNTLQ